MNKTPYCMGYLGYSKNLFTYFVLGGQGRAEEFFKGSPTPGCLDILDGPL